MAAIVGSGSSGLGRAADGGLDDASLNKGRTDDSTRQWAAGLANIILVQNHQTSPKRCPKVTKMQRRTFKRSTARRGQRARDRFQLRFNHRFGLRLQIFLRLAPDGPYRGFLQVPPDSRLGSYLKGCNVTAILLDTRPSSVPRMLPQVASKPNEKCNNYPVCTGRQKRPRVAGVKQTWLQYCSLCFTNPVCKESGCKNHVPSGGKIAGTSASWDPNGLCVEHIRASRSSCAWTFCSASSAGCNQLSMRYGKSKCYSCSQGRPPVQSIVTKCNSRVDCYDFCFSSLCSCRCFSLFCITWEPWFEYGFVSDRIFDAFQCGRSYISFCSPTYRCF